MADDDPTRTGTTRWRLLEGLRHEALDGEHLVLAADMNMVLRLDGEAARVFRAIAEGGDVTDEDSEILVALSEHGIIVAQ